MVVGHCAAGILGKSVARDVPLWLFLVAGDLIDLVSVALVPWGIEAWVVKPGQRSDESWAWALDLSHTAFTHNFVGALLISLAFTALCRMFGRGLRPAALLVLFLTAWSHWWLDLIVHRPDLGLFLDLQAQGWSLWRHAHASFALEALLVLAAMVIYLKRTRWLPGDSATATQAATLWRTWQLPIVLWLLLAIVTYKEPLSLPVSGPAGSRYYLVHETFLLCLLLLTWLAHRLDRHRGPALRAQTYDSAPAQRGTAP